MEDRGRLTYNRNGKFTVPVKYKTHRKQNGKIIFYKVTSHEQHRMI